MYTIIEYLNEADQIRPDQTRSNQTNLTYTVTLTLNQNEAIQTSTVPEFS